MQELVTSVDEGPSADRLVQRCVAWEQTSPLPDVEITSHIIEIIGGPQEAALDSVVPIS